MKSTTWTTATTNPMLALIGFLKCLEHCPNTWIEIQKNGEQAFPIMIENPALADPANWDMNYGVPGTIGQEELMRMNQFERIMTAEYTNAYGEPDAIAAYYKDGTLSDKLIKGVGTCFALKKSDFIALRQDLRAEGWDESRLWTTYWKPRTGIPYWIPADIDRVYVVCFDKDVEPAVDAKEQSIRSAISLLQSLLPNELEP